MKYEIFLAPRAKRQYEQFDRHIRNEIESRLWELEFDPHEKGSLLKGLKMELRYIKMSHAGVQYRAVYDIENNKKEVLVIFIGSRENFYKELRRFTN
jgi:mRNA-degrading endonuclease RelE of RelBE toxin-antitoxin system